MDAKEITEELMGDPRMAELVAVGIRAGDNQAKLVQAALLAAQAFDRLVSCIEKAAAKEFGE